MPDPIAVGWVLAATVRGAMNGQTTLTTWNYLVTEIAAGGVPSNILAITNFNTEWQQPGDMQDDYTNAMPANWVMDAMEFQWIAPSRYRKITFPNGNPGGGNPGDAHTSNLAVVITLNGEKATRRSISNKHLPGIAQDDYLDGILGNPTLASMTVLAAQTQADIVADNVTYKPIIYGRFIAPFVKCGVNKPGQPELKTLVTGATVRNTVRVMRRRTVGVGI